MRLLGIVVSVGWLSIGAASLLFAATPSPPQVAQGQQMFDRWCAPCHGREPREGGRYLPGTASLHAKYGDEKPSALEDRTDLPAEYTKVIIRRGVAGMPSFRKTEVSDREMEDIAVYLARNTR